MDDSLLRLQFAYIALLGACLGSFVNVVVARLPQGMSVVRPRSRCMQCQTPIAWYDNLPIVSYLLLRGRCRHCKASFSMRYMLVEVLMAGLAAALYVQLGFSWDLLAWLPLAAALLAITFLDIDHWWVPDVITYPAMLWAMGTAWLPGRLGVFQAALGMAPAVLLWVTAWGFQKVTGKEGLGFGDIKLLLLLGLGLGLSDALTALLLASVQGAVIGGLVVLRGGHRGAAVADEPPPPALAEDDWVPPAHAVPFGPFLVLGAFEVLLLPDTFGTWHHDLAAWVLRTVT